ncbi:MAG: hypothetical protein EOO77_24025 [Oxalobacteraceae bacterium]|nr:MAG: hypothetical protein EOO77_24025 [Oxalobacteraceae bacterium]
MSTAIQVCWATHGVGTLTGSGPRISGRSLISDAGNVAYVWAGPSFKSADGTLRRSVGRAGADLVTLDHRRPANLTADTHATGLIATRYIWW